MVKSIKLGSETGLALSDSGTLIWEIQKFKILQRAGKSQM